MALYILLFGCVFLLTNAEWIDKMENPGMFEGDIVLDPDEKEATFGKWNGKGNGYASIRGGRWPDAKIPYYIESSIGSKGRSAIASAIEDYHKHTCLRFFPRKNERSYISFYRGGGCSSPVGYRYGRTNRISLASGCQYKGITMHEIGHSIGLYHEQSRPDRDNFVRIEWNNIQSGMQFNFNKHSTRTIDSLGTPYDFSSMMHYGSKAFGRGRYTIRTKDPSKQKLIGRRAGFSEIDIIQINRMYCKALTTTATPKTTTTKTTVSGKTTTTKPGGTTPITTTTKRSTPPGECKNIDKRCYFWAQTGYCAESNAVEDKYVEIMKRKCCKACKEYAKCADRNSRCREWERRGECRKNPPYMHHNCRKSCKRCS